MHSSALTKAIFTPTQPAWAPDLPLASEISYIKKKDNPAWGTVAGYVEHSPGDSLS